jgi:hypothetical protein
MEPDLPDELFDDEFMDSDDMMDSLDPSDPDNYDPVDEENVVLHDDDVYGGYFVDDDLPVYDRYNDPDNF